MTIYFYVNDETFKYDCPNMTHGECMGVVRELILEHDGDGDFDIVPNN